ncbi:indole-3-glycerol phosphate synthase TrpC [Campylobacter sp. RM13119]|uniref:indole-3-glycerol phosphate synthase TrpC n=1 Tax=Campylobacter californiensis TaxID=1032243 RepID=UPI001473E4E1|nr:indole-3-glycerol phosphate synthase TrpC [Campylobacter sp. RM13119]MBE3605504.1 indole-3-glycerol phosphate synthase TrpC [Campylobacter sp. RM13119]
MILDEIINKTQEDLEERKKKYKMEWLERAYSANHYVPRNVISALKSTKDEPLRIIAEVKKASPSKGIIREDFTPLSIAKEYETANVNAISVLTEPHWFKGNVEYLTQIRRYTSTPLLRKDFIVDKYQLLEALIFGADFALLIVKALSLTKLKELMEYAKGIGLEILVEVHDMKDLEKALEVGAKIIGINHRNLDTFTMDMGLCEKLVPVILKASKDKVIVAESGLESHEQLMELNKIGVDAFLIGEHFMRKKSIAEAVISIKGGM